MFFVRLVGVIALVALNGFFAAAEFSLVAVRISRVRQLVGQGNSSAKIVESLLLDLHRVVSGVQLGITLTSLALGALGEATFANFFLSVWPGTPGTRSAILAHALSLTCAFVLLSGLHVVIGELVPKTVSLARAERVALLVARPFHWFLNTFRWAIDLLDGLSGAVVKALGVTSRSGHSVAHSTEELQVQIQQARERGLLAPGEEKFILSAIELGQVQVREIMVPRPDMHVLPIEAPLDQVMRVFATTQRSRIPVYRGTLDHMLGFVHIKDMMWVLLDRERRLEERAPGSPFDLRRVLRELLIVPETKPARELLNEFRSKHTSMAVVVDEFGSILGLVTMEDILEQLTGEIHDEFDVVERPLTLADGAVIFDAALSVRDLDAQYNIVLPEDPAYATVGGFVLDQLGFIPKGGESFAFGNFKFTVVEMDGRRVARVKIQLLPQESAGKGSPSADAGRKVETNLPASGS
ncbi:MAG: HlyC/CorC family transporter [Acidobacteria bacterium]|nr:HlyC/CorC family transporter [Acidobacteriota bacterium]MBS1866998.1 HlyC/CorC family transporter [Acidobacteriota bacterium]